MALTAAYSSLSISIQTKKLLLKGRFYLKSIISLKAGKVSLNIGIMKVNIILGKAILLMPSYAQCWWLTIFNSTCFALFKINIYL